MESTTDDASRTIGPGSERIEPKYPDFQVLTLELGLKLGFRVDVAPADTSGDCPLVHDLLCMAGEPGIPRMRLRFHRAQRAAHSTTSVNCSRGAFTLIEVVVAMAVFLAGMATLTLLAVQTSNLRRSTEERRVARNALGAIVQQARAISLFSQADAGGWAQAVIGAYQPGGNPGTDAAVKGLDPVDGAAAVAVVQVITDETLSDEQLGVILGMPRDLDGDGLATSGDVSATALLLPVVVTLQWTGASGENSIVQGLYIQSY